MKNFMYRFTGALGGDVVGMIITLLIMHLNTFYDLTGSNTAIHRNWLDYS